VIARLEERRAGLVAPALAALDAWRDSPERKSLKGLTQQHGGWPASARRKIDTVAPRLLQAAHARFIKALERARRRGSLERYHKLRISGKKLRYALQALSGHRGKPAKPTVKVLVTIQDGFGEYLDAARAADVLSELAAEPGWKHSARKACATLVEHCRAHAKSELEAMPGLLEKLDEQRWTEMLQALTGSKRRTK
jgi:CHAD domain-containing protein